jgi:hypothetical protein
MVLGLVEFCASERPITPSPIGPTNPPHARLPSNMSSRIPTPPSTRTVCVGPPFRMHSSFLGRGGVPQSQATSLAVHPQALHTSRVV